MTVNADGNDSISLTTGGESDDEEQPELVSL